MKKPYTLMTIDFIDHCTTDGALMAAPIHAQAAGWLVKEDEEAYYLASWISDDLVENADTEVATVMKCAIINLRRYK